MHIPPNLLFNFVFKLWNPKDNFYYDKGPFNIYYTEWPVLYSGRTTRSSNCAAYITDFNK